MRALRFLAAVTCLLLLCFAALAEDTDFTWQEQGNGTVIITSWTGTGDQVTVPETLGGLAVSGIGSGVFAGKTALTVSLPDGFTNIDKNAFGSALGGMPRIECDRGSVTAHHIPVRFYDPEAPDLALRWMTGTQLWVVSYSGEAAEIQIPSGVNVIGGSVFRDKRNISVFLPDSVSRIGSEAFAGGKTITVYLPDHVTTFDSNALGDGGTIPWVRVICDPESDTSHLLPCPFRAPEAPFCVLRWVEDELTMVDVDTSGGSVALPSVSVVIPAETMAKLPCFTLPGDLHAIESEAFRGCGENRIVIPSGVESIGAYAFADSPNLVMIRFPSGEIAIDDTCLSNCPHVTVCAPAGSAALRWAQGRGLSTAEE